jgi:hypothetical protein
MTKPKAQEAKISELKIGPFSGGINRYSDNSAIADTELVDCVNFDIDLDGSLKSRPPINTMYAPVNTTYTTQTFVEASTEILGSFVFNAGDKVVIYQYIEKLTSPDAINTSLMIYYIDGPNAGTTHVINTVANALNPWASVTRYKNTLYFTTVNGGAGAKMDIATLAYTALVSIPSASKGIIYKERLWLVGDVGSNYSRLYFSDVANPEVFQPASFFDIRPGDGERLNDAIVYQDNLILFKNSSIWVFAYDTQVTQAVLQQLHEELGVENSKSTCLYENVVYFLKYNQVYQIDSFNFARISTKLPFEEDRTTPVATGGENWSNATWKFPNWLSLVGDRLVCRFYNRLYVYHLRTRAWSRWNSQDNNVQYMGPIIKVETASASNRQNYDTYVMGSALNKPPFVGLTNKCIPTLMKMQDTYDANSLEGVSYVGGPATTVSLKLNILTKIYDIGISHRFKRLMHWGCDIVTGQNVTGTLYPYSLAYRVTWAQLHALQWNQLQTWGYPLFAQPSTTQTAVADSGVYRRYIRFPRSLRFRLLQFGLDLQTLGNTKDGPARLYSITAFIGQKQHVSKGVN